MSRVEKFSVIGLDGLFSTPKEKNMKHALLQSLFILGMACTLSAREPYVFQIESEDVELNGLQFAHEGSFADFIDTLGQQVDTTSPYTIQADVNGPFVIVKIANNGQPPRDYWSPITPQEKKDLSELVRTLSNEKHLTLLGKKSELEAIEGRIVHLHPLKFLTIIFTDDALKACMKNMEGKAIVWKRFQSETVNSLTKENNAGNLTADQINDFAAKIGMKSADIASYINGQRWEQLITFLIGNVTIHKPQGKKYNM